MLTCLLALALVNSAQEGEIRGDWRYLGDPNLPATRLAMFVRTNKLDPPKLSPLEFGNPPQKWMFEWLVSGYCRPVETGQFELRFRVFAQENKHPDFDAPDYVARNLIHLWDHNYTRFKVEHSDVYNNRTVDVYLCYGGKAGGEQLFGQDTEGNPPRTRKVNTIYIYDIRSFTDPVEMAREVAHEYGHASLPPVGGFKEPEDWANGYLGEKMFLRWLRDELAAGRIEPIDVMGADLKSLDAWVKKNVDPLVTRVALNGPQRELMEGTGQGAMDAFLGTVLYADAIIQPDVVYRAFKLMGSQKAADFPKGLEEAVRQKKRVVLGIPKYLEGKNIWVPLPGGTVNGATIVKRSQNWALVKPGLGAITLQFD